MKVTYYETIELSKINENDREYQPRLEYDEDAIKLLAEDITKNGQHNPAGLYFKGDHYQVVYGFQRVIAMKKLGKESIRANVYEGATTSELHAQAISNNERHMDLNELERALYVSRLKQSGMGVDEIGQMFGLNKSVIYNLLTISELDESTQGCLRAKRISLNHAVELAREKDISKRLEILTRALTYSWSFRDLKHYEATGQSPVGSFGTMGDIGLCPHHLCRVGIEKKRTEEELKKAGWGPGPIKAELEDKTPNCEECPHFRGLTSDWFVQCAFDQSKLLPGIKKLVDWGSAAAAVDNAYPVLEEYRLKRWSHLVKTQAVNITLIGLRHLTVGGFMGYYQSEADAFDDALAKTNTLLNSMRKRLDEVDAIEDKSKAMAEFKLLSRCAGELQNAWAEKHLRASRKVGQLLNEWRQNYGRNITRYFVPL